MDQDKPDLGRKIGKFKPKTSYFILSLLAGAILFVLGLYTAVQTLFLQPEIEIIHVLLAFLFFYLSAVLAWFAYRRYKTLGTGYVLYEQGVQRLDGAGERRMSWNQVKIVKRASRTVRPGSETSNQGGRRRWRTWELVGEDATSLTIEDQPRLAAMIVGMLLVYEWPLMYRRIENGEQVVLSRMFISKEGLEYKGNLVPWSRINQAETTDHIKLDTTAGRINWPEINIHDDDDVLGYLMLQRVIKYYVGRKR